MNKAVAGLFVFVVVVFVLVVAEMQPVKHALNGAVENIVYVETKAMQDSNMTASYVSDGPLNKLWEALVDMGN